MVAVAVMETNLSLYCNLDIMSRYTLPPIQQDRFQYSGRSAHLNNCLSAPPEQQPLPAAYDPCIK